MVVLPDTTGLVAWDDLQLSAGDAIRAHWYGKGVWPNPPTPLERFALGPDALLIAQTWTLNKAYLPSESWWAGLRRSSDDEVRRAVARVSRIVRGGPPRVGHQIRDAWSRWLLPGMLQEGERRRESVARTHLPSGPPLDVLEAMRELTGERGMERRGEVWFHCPFHPDRTPSLSVNVEAAVWKCLGCGRGGGWKDLPQYRRAHGLRGIAIERSQDQAGG